MSQTRLTRWGLLGAADIARKNWKSILLSGNGVVAAVASRELAQSEAFIRENQAHAPMPVAPKACAGYEAVVTDPAIDAVYVPVPTALRGEWVIRAARAGKHVLCEKPCARDAAELTRMLEACRDAGVQFMDGVMFMHSRRLNAMQTALHEEKAIGRIQRITSAFSFCGDEGFLNKNIRLHSGLEPHGSVGDLGWYNIRYTLAVLGETLPRRVQGRLLKEAGRPDSPGPVPLELTAEMEFDGGVSAGFYCSFNAGDQQWARVSGTEGSLVIDDFVLPFFGSQVRFQIEKASFHKYGSDFNMEPAHRVVAVSEYSNSYPNAQESLMFRRFNHLAQSGKPDPYWPECAMRTQRVMDAILRSARSGGGPVELA
ncbi:MAG: Gfo/Idh/MocA family oxidoreductase [Verrucomicrobia bacterium]|nr:Gfo/Idh/MocA family oxidoreductase [Verrucomicrobiota bacterium]